MEIQACDKKRYAVLSRLADLTQIGGVMATAVQEIITQASEFRVL
jgi:hypothetical protein